MPVLVQGPAVSSAVTRLPRAARAHPDREDPGLGMAQPVPLVFLLGACLAMNWRLEPCQGAHCGGCTMDALEDQSQEHP